jgi:hypothetical protein
LQSKGAVLRCPSPERQQPHSLYPKTETDENDKIPRACAELLMLWRIHPLIIPADRTTGLSLLSSALLIRSGVMRKQQVIERAEFIRRVWVNRAC